MNTTTNESLSKNNAQATASKLFDLSESDLSALAATDRLTVFKWCEEQCSNMDGFDASGLSTNACIEIVASVEYIARKKAKSTSIDLTDPFLITSIKLLESRGANIDQIGRIPEEVSMSVGFSHVILTLPSKGLISGGVGDKS